MKYVFICVLLLVSCTSTLPQVYQEDITLDLFFCKQDNCTHQLLKLLETAHTSIHCAFYDLEIDELYSVLHKQSNTIDVKIVLEQDNHEEKPVYARYDTNRNLMHNKFCVVDERDVWTGSFNPTSRGNNLNENHGILISSAFIAQNFEEEFIELWEGYAATGRKTMYTPLFYNESFIETLFCPEDRCEQRVVELIGSANHSVYFLLFSFTSERIADALLFTEHIEIKGVMDSSQAANAYSQFTRLEGFGIDIHKDKVKGKLHHKVFIVDNSTIVTGSYNPTSNGAWRNDENLLIIQDKNLAEQFLGEFDRIYGESITNE